MFETILNLCVLFTVSELQLQIGLSSKMVMWQEDQKLLRYLMLLVHCLIPGLWSC